MPSTWHPCPIGARTLSRNSKQTFGRYACSQRPAIFSRTPLTPEWRCCGGRKACRSLCYILTTHNRASYETGNACAFLMIREASDSYCTSVMRFKPELHSCRGSGATMKPCQERLICCAPIDTLIWVRAPPTKVHGWMWLAGRTMRRQGLGARLVDDDQSRVMRRTRRPDWRSRPQSHPDRGARFPCVEAPGLRKVLL